MFLRLGLDTYLRFLNFRWKKKLMTNDSSQPGPAKPDPDP